MAALTRLIPPITMHRSSMANASKIAEENILQALDFPPGFLLFKFPILVPYPKAVSAFFTTWDNAMTELDLTFAGFPGITNVRYNRNSINLAFKRLNQMIWIMSGEAFPGLAPVLTSNIPDTDLFNNGDQVDCGSHFYGATSYSITSYPASNVSFDTATGIIEYISGTVGTFQPIVTAHNDSGATASNAFKVNMYTG